MKTLDQIKAEMRNDIDSGGYYHPDYKDGFRAAVQCYEMLLSQLEPEDAKLRRVREKVSDLTFLRVFGNCSIEKNDVLEIIDAELTNKEQQVEKTEEIKEELKYTKCKVEFEVNVPEGYEIHSPRIWREHHHMAELQVFFRPIEPPLELETNFFSTGYSDLNHIIRQSENESGTKYGQLDYCWKMTQSEARDLAKILNYWADNEKLPERVVVKTLPPQGGK